MNIIISGGSGFIGSHLTRRLLLEGHKVIVVDNFITGRVCSLPSHPYLTVLNKDIATCRESDFFGQVEQKIDGVVHLAAIPSVEQSWEQPQKVNDNNCSSILRVIELCQELTIPRLVFASSAAVYGQQQKMPISENQPKLPLSPYGLQKLMCEEYARLFSQKFQYSCIVLRLFNVYGYKSSSDSRSLGVIDSFINSFMNNLPIEIHGDGSQTRDFVAVTDVTQSITQALTISLQPRTFEICNIGSGKATSLIELIDILKILFPQWTQDITYKNFHLGDIKNSIADISKAKSLLCFSPKSPLIVGLKKLIWDYCAFTHCMTKL